MQKLLIICGPTATGKTSLGIKLAKQFDGEIISADSRQVYSGLDIVTGKDINSSTKYFLSSIKWRDRFLKYYILDGVKIWLYDIVNPDESFNVAFWKELFDLVTADILARGKLPIVVGGTGLYIKSIYSKFNNISIEPNLELRSRLISKPVDELFSQLNTLNPIRAAQLNTSDRKNPRRLIRAIEIAMSPPLTENHSDSQNYDILNVGLTADMKSLNQNLINRINSRLAEGALSEIKKVITKYGSDLPSLSAIGYKVFGSSDFIEKWRSSEYQYIRRQLTWFKKQSAINWFNSTKKEIVQEVMALVQSWYNK